MKNSKDNKTADLIRHMAFRLLLEKGYEAMNLREIGAEAGINASTIYFYYKSKKELFLEIYNNVLQTHISLLKEIAKTIEGETDTDLIKEMFLKEIEMVYTDSASYKLLLRYRMFPVAELIDETRELSLKYDEEEFQIWQPFLASYCGKTAVKERMYYMEIKRLMNAVTNEMIISGQAAKRYKLGKVWDRYNQSLTGNLSDNLFF